jgi:hypothetical protein
MHTVADISCSQCKTIVGWTYFAATERDQHYKVGKSVIEKQRWLKLLNETPADHFQCSDEVEPASIALGCALQSTINKMASQNRPAAGAMITRPLLL